MKNVAIIKNMEGEVLEIRNFYSRPAVERYIAAQYKNNVFDWTLRKRIDVMNLTKLTEWVEHSIVIKNKEEK